MLIPRVYNCCATLWLAVAVTQAAAQPVIFSDDTFDDSDWTAKIILNEVGDSAQFEATQRTRSGNPGAFRRILHEGEGTSRRPRLHVGHLRQGAAYDPQVMGPIDSVSYSYDLINLEDSRSYFTDYYLLIFQNDAYYRVQPPSDRIEQRSWASFGRDGLGAADFTRVSGSGPSRPDFSATASPLQLGFASVSRFEGGISPGLSDDDSRNSGIDNWMVTVVSAGATSCQIQPRNTFLPLHFLEPHLFNRDGHPPHELSVAARVNSVPVPAGTELSLVATKPVFLDTSGNPSLTEETVQTDADGRAVFEYIPPSLEPLDRTDFEVRGSVEDASFSCRGSVVTGLGALTASFQGLIDQQKAIALLGRVWDKLIVRVAVGGDAGAMSKEFLDELERITREDPAFLAGLRESVEAQRPLLERIAAGQQVTAGEEALQEFEDLLARLEPPEDSDLERAVGGVRKYLAKARRVVQATGTNRRPTSEARLVHSAQEQRVLQHSADPVAVRIQTAHDKLQLRFEANLGQVSGDVHYLARGPGYNLYLLPAEAVVVSGIASRGLIGPPSVVRIQLAGAQPAAKPRGLGELPGKSHYLLGQDAANWRTDVPHYEKVRYSEVYPGVDLVYYGRQNQLEYDFVVAPGASPDVISFGFEGIERLQLGGGGDLVLNVGEADFRLKKPFIYQNIEGVRRRIAGDYELRAGGLVGFEVEAYDASRPLVIDPILSYSSYVGGAEYDAGGDIAVGPDGSAYLTGATSSINFPTETPLQADSAGGIPVGVDAFVIKLDPSGSEVVYSTYIGGSHIDFGMGIAVDDQGNAFVTGETRSEDFPIAEAMQKALAEAAADPAPAAIEPNLAIRVAMRRRALAERLNFWQWGYYYQQVTGRPQPDAFRYLRPKPGVGEWTVEEIENYEMTADRWWDLMTTPRSGQSKGEPSEIGARSAFVMKLDPTGSSLTYSTYLGGTGDDRGTSIAIDGEGNAYVAGTTASTDFPVRDAIQTVHGGGELFYAFDAFAAKLNAAGTELVFATFLGGSEYDAARGIAVDAAGNAYVSGTTESPNFPTTTDAFQRDGPAVEEEYDAFVTKLDGAGSLLYSTFLGGGSQDFGFAIAVDADGNAYTTGITGSPDFPLLNPAQGQFGSNDLLGFDAFVTKLNADGTGLIYSTFLGGGGTEIGFGIAVDSDGNTYVAGETDSMDFPTATALQPVTGGRSDGFVTKLDPTGSALDFSTYLGGSDYDSVQGLALTQDRDVYVAGLSLSSDSPVTFGAFQTSSEGLADALVAKISEGEPPPPAATIQAASGALTVAPDSLASGFGIGVPLADMVASAAEVPLPTELAGVSVRITDSQGVQ